MKPLWEKARDLFEAFHGRKAKRNEIVGVTLPPSVTVLKIGNLDGVIYTPLGKKRKYIHQFKKTARPVLAVTHDGEQLYILAGEYKFTERGIEK